MGERDQISLGEFLRRRRREMGLTLREAATLTGLSNSLISQIETGCVKSPSIQTVGQLSLAYKLSILGLERLSRGLPYVSFARDVFDEWWTTDGMFIDPDTDDVPWFDKRKGLAAYAFAAGSLPVAKEPT